jgi:8-oxo-dGTP pyrophosphatase MutT (NUDIX family)
VRKVPRWASGPPLPVGTVEAALSRRAPRPDEEGVPLGKKAAVAAVLRDGAEGAELLFIRRAEHPRDPWSGQMALPGGRVDPGDGSPFDAAVRETLEEVGLDLGSGGRPIGRLSEVRTHLPLGRPPHSVVPFCFALQGDPPLVPNYEVAEGLWIPLAFLADPVNRRPLTWVRRGVPVPMPSIDRDGRAVWGLTLRIVEELLEVVDGPA